MNTKLIPTEKLYEALRKMGAKHLKAPYNTRWTPECPVTGYCYVVSEVIFRCCDVPWGTRPCVATMPNGDKHWFLRTPDGWLLDQTWEQYGSFNIPENWKKASFLTSKLSKRGQILADLLGLKEKDNGRENQAGA